MKGTPKIYIPNFEPLGHIYTTPDTGEVLSSVTQILKNELGSFNWGTVNAPSRGTEVDLACQNIDNNKPDERIFNSELNPYINQYKKALKEEDIVILHNQLMRYHPKYWYAGTLDKIGLVRGKMALIDLKTGYDYPQYRWQLAAYAEFVKNEFGVLERYSLRLTTTKYVLKPYKGTRDFLEFLALNAAHTLKKNNGFIKEFRR